MKKQLPLYPCAQKDFYTIANIGWAHYAQYQPQFQAYKPLYTIAHGTTALAALQAALALPDNQQRGATAETQRIQLLTLAAQCLQNIQFLKGYIQTAFPNPALWKPHFEAIGIKSYRQASQQEWESMIALNQSAIHYISQPPNLTTLLAHNNMPASFPANLTLAANAFSTHYSQFLSSRDTTATTALKITANNQSYKTLHSMFRDARRIFKGDQVTLAKFTFKTILHSIHPPTAGIKGIVKETDTNLPIPATLNAQQPGKKSISIQCNPDGTYSQHLAPGKYTLTVNAPGYQSHTQQVTLKLSGLRKITVHLTQAQSTSPSLTS